jgi:hypothetical protein
MHSEMPGASAPYSREHDRVGASVCRNALHSLTLATGGILPLLLCLCASFAQAGPVEASIVAIMRLSDQPNNSWVATISDDARTYDVMGRTVRGGLTHVTMPIINSVRRQLGRSVTDTQIELIYRGNVECVIETDDGWRKLSELPPVAANDARGGPAGTAIYGAGVSTPGGRVNRGRPARGPNAHESGPQAYSNLQLGISHPHEELGVIVGSHVEFKVEGDVITGTLTDLGAQLLLVRDGQQNLTPLRASGSFRIWLRDGMVAKYQLKLQGTLQVQLPAGRKEVLVNQTTDTIVKDIGKTKFDVPDEARSKLGL